MEVRERKGRHQRDRFPAGSRKAWLFVRVALVLAIGMLTIFLGACGGGSGGGPGSPGNSGGSGNAGGTFTPKFYGAKFHRDKAEGSDEAAIDLSAVRKGYVAVSAKVPAGLKFQVVCGQETYNYDIASDGTPSVFPLQCGNGSYTFRIMKNITQSKYAEYYTASADVALKDEFQPFLRPSDYVNFSKKSACVAKASEISAKAGSAMDVVSGVYDYICDNVTYDEAKAATVQEGYMPSPDETLQSGKGICFDYASLAAAMLRSQGIPTKVIFGYVSPDDLYHAWNMFYTEETGWVTVDYEVKQGGWNRLDLTFSANGEDSEFIGDGGNYSDVYTY